MRAQIPILSSQSIFLFGKSSASCTFYLGSMELLCTLGGNVINPDRTEKKLIGQGHKRQNLGSVVHCIGRLHHLHQHWHRRHRDWGQGSVSVLRVTINIFTNSLYFGAGDKYQVWHQNQKLLSVILNQFESEMLKCCVKSLGCRQKEGPGSGSILTKLLMLNSKCGFKKVKIVIWHKSQNHYYEGYMMMPVEVGRKTNYCPGREETSL